MVLCRSQDLCICPRNTYRPCFDVDNGATRAECLCDSGFYTPSSSASRCISCPEGMNCAEGSDEQFFPCAAVDIENSTVHAYPKPDEGYFVLLEQPTWVFKCIDLASCPGGQADNCGEGLRGVACGACDAGYYKQGGTWPAWPVLYLSIFFFSQSTKYQATWVSVGCSFSVSISDCSTRRMLWMWWIWTEPALLDRPFIGGSSLYLCLLHGALMQ